MNRVFKSGFVTIIGRPNVGKSTLMNQLIGQKIAITSSKAQTTRNRIQTVYTSEEGQIVFLDTPGINKAKNKLGDYMLMAAERTLNEVDLILWLVEPTTFIGGGEQYIIEGIQARAAGPRESGAGRLHEGVSGSVHLGQGLDEERQHARRTQDFDSAVAPVQHDCEDGRRVEGGDARCEAAGRPRLRDRHDPSRAWRQRIFRDARRARQQRSEG